MYIITILTTARKGGCHLKALSSILQLSFLRRGEVKCPVQSHIVSGEVGVGPQAGLRGSVCSLWEWYCLLIVPGRHRGFKKVTWESYHLVAYRSALSYCSVFFSQQIFYTVVLWPDSLHIHLWLGHPPQSYTEKVGWRENADLAKVLRRAQGNPL